MTSRKLKSRRRTILKKSPIRKVSRRKSLRRKSVRRKSSRQKVSRRKSPRRKSQRRKSPRRKVDSGDSERATNDLIAEIASDRPSLGIIENLIRDGADVNAVFNIPVYHPYAPSLDEENTLLHYASGPSCNVEIADILINNGASIDAKNINGDTPLHLASKYGCTSLVELLLNSRADINSRNDSGNTPLHIALDVYERDVEDTFTDIIEILITRGARIDIANNINRTVTDYVTFPDLLEEFEFALA
jgi:ankyrin repeat protein